jgi:alpha-2-macroglobulin
MDFGWMARNEDSLVVLPDRREYRPGDVAQVLIPAPFEEPSKVLLTTERAGVISHTVLESNGKPFVYSLPLGDADSPTVYFQAVFITPASADNPRPRFRVTFPFEISVASAKPLLNVQVMPSKTQAKPGESITFAVRVTDSEGKPVGSA